MSGNKIGIVVAGQSNSLGTNGRTISVEALPPLAQWDALFNKSDLEPDDVLDVAPGELDAPMPGVHMLSQNNAGSGSGSLPYTPAAAGTFMPAQNPMQNDDTWKEQSCFAFQMAKLLKLKLAPNDEIYLIHAGLGATGLGPGDIRQNVDWDPGAGVDFRAPGGNPIGIWYPDRPVPGSLPFPNGVNRYQRMLDMVAQAKIAEPTLRVQGLVWHQGEADTNLDFKDYFTEIAYMLNRARQDMGEPNMAVVIGTLQGFWQGVGPTVAEAHDLSSSWMRNMQVCRMREVNLPDDPQLNPSLLNDRTHISRDGHRIMAAEYAKAFQSLHLETGYAGAQAAAPSFPVTSPICLDGLCDGAQYQLTVAATNAQGTGSSSPAQSFTILTPPKAPIGVRAWPHPNVGAVFVEWALGFSVEGGAAFVRYEIEVQPNAGAPFTIVETTRDPSERLVTGLVNAQLYSFRVRIVNTQFTSAWSTATAQVRVGLPGAPSTVGATPGHGGGVVPSYYSALVSYIPPATAVGAQIIEYEATASPGGAKGVVADGGFVLMRGLQHNVAYTFTVRARNSAGYGPASAPSAPVVPLNTITVASAPQAVNVVSTGQTATINITPPASNGGSPIALYRVEVVPTVSVVYEGIRTVTGGTSIVVNDLFVGLPYFVIVWALNAAGYGAAVDTSASQFTPTTSAPSAPSGVVATNLGSLQASIAFTPSASTGGATQVYYRAQSSVGGVFQDARASPITVSGLTPGPQTFTVRAANGDRYVDTAIGTRSATSAPSASVVVT